MARQISLTDTGVTVRLTGLTRLAALRGRLHVPFSAIADVSAAPPRISSFALRLPGLTVPFTDIRAGVLYHEGGRWFCSYERAAETLTVFLRPGSPFRAVALGTPAPEALRARLLERVRAAA
jgi:hypothetical protein